MFVDIGKGGSDIKAMAEALGRLASLVLRVSSPLTPRERIQEIVAQLTGIGGPRSTGFGRNRVRSLPDALAQALEEQYLLGDDVHPALPSESAEFGIGEVALPEPPAPQSGVQADLCPSCGNTSLVAIEGCQSCYNCGHSEC